MVVRATILGFTLSLITAFPALAEARFFRSEQVPNGQKLDCSLCHLASNGDGPRNAFGSQIEAMGLDGNGEVQNQNVVWAQIYMLDADDDGFTNGYELGDPDGEWATGMADPRLDPSLPGDPESLPCPNGSRHPDEECDGEDFGEATCATLGFAAGDLTCNEDCTIDTSMCVDPVEPDMGLPTDDMGVDAPGDDVGELPPTDAGDSPPIPEPDTGRPDDPNGSAHPYFDRPPPDEPSSRGCAGALDVQGIEGVDVGSDAPIDASLLVLLLGWTARRR